jgi:hypothetical protein
MNNPKIKVLYIAGWGRSGSTLLARILGQLEGYVHTGELRTIWTDGFKPKAICGCSLPVSHCELWQAVFDRGWGGMATLNPQAMAQLRLQTEPRSQDILFSRLLPGRQSQLQAKLESYIEVLSRLYSAIAEITQAEIIVDDSLHPGYGYTLTLVPNLQVYILHLVRDARGCAYSWQNRRKKGLGSYSLSQSALGWSLRNWVTEMLGHDRAIPYLRVRYEDFIDQPQETLFKILDFAQTTAQPLPLTANAQVRLTATHSIFGNDNRTQTGLIQLHLDEVWKREMALTDQLKVNALTWPLLLKYGYFLRKQTGK